MIIPCFRCGKEIDTPGLKAKRIPHPDGKLDKEGKVKMVVEEYYNADYIVAEDTIGIEMREVLVALKHNQATLEKQSKKEEITDEEYDTAIVASYEEARSDLGEGLAKVVVRLVGVEVQKTGVICPGCYRDADFVIWGTHKIQRRSEVNK